MAKILLVLAFAALARAAPYEGEAFISAVPPPEQVFEQTQYASVPAISQQYKYSYSVNDGLTGDHKDQVESRDGDIVHGQYSLVEPDGLSRRVVDYSADALNGFNAHVHNEPIVRAEPVAFAPAIHAKTLPVQPILQTYRHVAPIVPTHNIAVTPALRSEAIAVQPALHTILPSVKAEPLAYVPPAVSTQTVSRTNHIVHPQPITYQTALTDQYKIASPAVRTVTPALQTHHIAAVQPTIPIHQVLDVAPTVRSHLIPNYTPLVQTAIPNYGHSIYTSPAASFVRHEAISPYANYYYH